MQPFNRLNPRTRLLIIFAAGLASGLVIIKLITFAAAPAVVPPKTTVTLHVTDSKLDAPTVVHVKKGTKVELTVNSTNQAEECNLMLPDFKINTTFSQGSVGKAEFKADKAGTYPINLHAEEHPITKAGELVVEA